MTERLRDRGIVAEEGKERKGNVLKGREEKGKAVSEGEGKAVSEGEEKQSLRERRSGLS